MNTEIADNNVKIVGWLFHDGDCRLCRQSARRVAGLLGRRGIELRTLQSPDTTELLGLSGRDLLREMRLLLADVRNLGGADAVVEIARRIWWAWPLWLVSCVPGVKPLLRAVYRIVAANRHCQGGVCAIHRRHARLDWLPLLLFPAAVVILRNSLPAWVFMWLMSFAIFSGFKWLTFRDPLAGDLAVPLKTRLIYLFCWPGMSLKEFAAKPPVKERMNSVRRWLAPTARSLVGAGLVWLAVPAIPSEAWLLRGWVGMIGTIMMLHFGTFHLLTLALQACGFNARPNMQSPWLARSMADFWGNRWNTAFNVLANRYGFRLLAPGIGSRMAIVVVFLASGFLHEAVITLPARGGFGLPAAYFALQAAGLLVERLPLIRHRPWRKRLFTWLVLIAPLGCLFAPVFVHTVILPMLHAIGETRNAL